MNDRGASMYRLAIDEFLADLAPPRTDPFGDAIACALTSPGKRLRPTLSLVIARAFGAPLSAALPAAAGVELVHTMSLVHDDLPAMDDAELRRGRPTLHKSHGEAVAILAGDALLALAFEVVATADELPAERRIAIAAVLSRACGVGGLAGGQAVDLAGSAAPDARALRRLASKKTGVLFEAAAVVGGLAAGVDDNERACLARFGRALGVAFQAIDDIADAREDRALGRVSFVSVLGLDGAIAEAASALDACDAARRGLPVASRLGAVIASMRERVEVAQ